MSAARSLSTSLQQLNRILLANEAAAVPDAELVRRFVERRDEVAFAAIVQRYGLLVFGVCRRVLRHEQDAEDAFQATFLIFARDAASVQRTGAIGNWLYGVAHNVARKAKAARYRRALKEGEAAASRPTADASAVAPDDLPQLLEAELGQLPDKYRAAVVLCDLLGQTTRQAADAVGCPPKTLGTRLSRGRALLARRLARRGVVFSAALLTAALAPCPTACGALAPELLASTVQLASNYAAGSATVPPAVASLTSGVSRVMVFNSLKYVLLACSLLGAGALATRPVLSQLHAVHAARPAARDAGAGSRPLTREAPPPPPVNHLEQLHRLVLSLLPWDVTATHASADDKPKPLTGTWVKKEGELKIEFAETELRVYPHGENKVIVIVCEYSRDKNDVVKAKITVFEGKEEAKKAIAAKLPVGTEFTFQWKADKDTATLKNVKGEKAELLKSHLDGEFGERK